MTAWKFNVLVVANRTADTPELSAAMLRRHGAAGTHFTLLVPCSPGQRDLHHERLERVLARLRSEGLDVSGRIGNSDPILAVNDVWDPAAFDEIIVATLPTSTSRWSRLGVPQRLERMTGARVTHVITGGGVPSRT